MKIKSQIFSFFFIFFIAIFCCGFTYAQQSLSNIDTVRQKDIRDIIKEIFHRSSFLNDTSVLKKNVNISIFPAAGYSLQTRLVAIVAGNMAFNLGKDPNEKLSAITASLAYTENNQIILPISSNIWTKNNKYNLLGDWRATKYPQDTYGLGGHTSLDSADLVTYDYIRFNETILRHIVSNFYAGIGYTFNYHWNIRQSGNPGGSETDYTKYGFAPTSTSSGVSMDLLYDGRDNPINPSKSFYANVVYTNNVTFLGSNTNWQSLVFDVRKYFQFPGNSNNVLAFWTYDWLTLKGNPPYLDLPATSWDPNTNTGRGYIQGRFRSKQMLYLESEYRFGLTRNGLLGGVMFINTQAFSDWPSGNFETLYPGMGAGLRIKLNKESKTNIDLDYGFGLGGSHGLTVNLGEIF